MIKRLSSSLKKLKESVESLNQMINSSSMVKLNIITWLILYRKMVIKIKWKLKSINKLYKRLTKTTKIQILSYCKI